MLRMATTYEYLKSLDEEKQKSTQELIEKESDHVLVELAEFVEQGKQKDLTWKRV